MTSGYLPSGTNTSFGTNSNEEPITQTKFIKNTVRTTVQAKDGLVSVGGLRSTPEALAAAGLVESDEHGKPVPMTARNAPLSDTGKAADATARLAEAEKAREIARADAEIAEYNNFLDHAEKTLGPSYQAFVDAAIANEADAVNAVPDVVVNTLYSQAEKFIAPYGIPAEVLDSGMVDFLSESERQDALAHLVSGRGPEFAQLASRAFNNALQYTQSHEFLSGIAAEGGHIENGFLYIGSVNYGPAVQCLLNGTIYYDGDDE